MANHLTLYSSGIGVFVRQFDITSKQEIRFPIKKSHRGDVISSLRLFGDVTQKGMVGWPQEEKTQLTINPDNAQESLLAQLSGRQISFRQRGGTNETKTGTNLGIQKTEEMFGGNVITKSHLVVLSKDGEQNRYPLDQIENLKFTEEEVQSEITKALLNNASKLREGVTYVSLSLVGNNEDAKSCHLQYAHPMPSWQPTYRLTETATGKLLLSCFAKADIDSEEDLKDCQLTFIVGEPDTFETDLAEAKIPGRRKINLVKKQVSGGHMVEEGQSHDSEYECASVEAVGGARYASRSRSAMPAPAPMAAMASFSPEGMAKTVQAEAAEVGDYSRWTTPGTFDLKSRQSGLIPLFTNTEVKGSRVLYYKNTVEANRPKLAMQLSNSLKQSLGMGVCTVYRDEGNRSDMTGEAILQAIKPGQTTMLVYGTETGVLVRREQSQTGSDLMSFVLNQGTLIVEHTSRATVTYKLKNNKAEEFKVVVDHDRVLANSKIESGKGVAITESLDNGVRLAVTLPANGEATLVITETRLDKQSIAIGLQQWQHYFVQYAERCNLTANPSVNDIIKAQQVVSNVDAEITSLKEENNRLTTTQNRLLGLLKANVTQAQASEWQGQLSNDERRLRSNEEKLDKLAKTREQSLSALSDTIKKATVKWTSRGTAVETIK